MSGVRGMTLARNTISPAWAKNETTGEPWKVKNRANIVVERQPSYSGEELVRRLAWTSSWNTPAILGETPRDAKPESSQFARTL